MIYVIKKNGKVQSDMGTHSSHQKAEDFIYRHVTEDIQKTGERFFQVVKQYTVGTKRK